ncbi:MAG: hypothetical protein ACYC2O_05265 [Microthrixaceae bacterium]
MGSTGDEADLRAPTPVAAPGTAGHAVARGDARDAAPQGAGDLDRNPLTPLRRIGAGAALDQGVDLLRFRFRRLVGLTACLFLPVQLVDLVLRLTVSSAPADEVDLGGAAVLQLGSSDWVGVTIVLRALALSVLGICVGHLVAALLGGRDASFRELLGVGQRRSWVALAMLPLSVLIRAVLIWIPFVGFVVGDALVFVASIVVGAERVGPIAALGRNLRLTRRQSGAAIALSLGSLVITMILRMSLYAGPQALLYSLGSPESVFLAVEQLGALVQLVIEPLTACIAATSYLLLRCRVDGLDLELRRAARSVELDARVAGGTGRPPEEVLADATR